MVRIEDIVKEGADFIKSEFNLNLVKSNLKNYSEEQWNQFCNLNNFDASSTGMYLPVSNIAYTKNNSSFLPADIFHELFGHGLFVEHSKIGIELTDLIKANGDERSFMFDRLDRSSQLFGLADYNIQNYEGFAVWMENLLSKETGNLKVFENKKSYLNNDYLQLLDNFNEMETTLSRFGLMAQMGFPKFYDNNIVLDVMTRYYGSKLKDVDFILLRGSKKPTSDIDLFVVSKNASNNYFNGWLDIYELNHKDFFDWGKKLDISVTDPMLEGTLIYGDETRFQKYKQQIINQKVTPEAISHNLSEAKKLQLYSTNIEHKEISRKKYIDSFTRNAEQLSKGNKPLTLLKLNELYL